MLSTDNSNLAVSVAVPIVVTLIAILSLVAVLLYRKKFMKIKLQKPNLQEIAFGKDFTVASPALAPEMAPILKELETVGYPFT